MPWAPTSSRGQSPKDTRLGRDKMLELYSSSILSEGKKANIYDFKPQKLLQSTLIFIDRFRSPARQFHLNLPPIHLEDL